MKIISHRGYWRTAKEKNTEIAFRRSFDLTLGTETDIRDYNGNLVISHDIPDRNSMRLDKFLDIFTQYDSYDSMCLALNIKSDGLQQKLKFMLSEYDVDNYFVFDMSVPDHINSISSGLNCYVRLSEYESCSQILERSSGIWLDSFGPEWYDASTLRELIGFGKQICIVSSELHNRNYLEQWKLLSELHDKRDLITLCTDVPEDAIKFFNYKEITK